MDYTVAVIGGGVIGSAVAFYLSQNGVPAVILEKSNDIASATTKANSGIIHAGYDPKHGTLMARLNVEGNGLVKDLCHALNVPHKHTGSLVLAFDRDDEETIKDLYENGVKNGVLGLEILSAQKVRQMEPEMSHKVIAALYAPSAFIASPWELCIALADTAIVNGTRLLTRFEVTGITPKDGGFLIESADGGRVTCEYVVNAAGIKVSEIHALIGGESFEICPNKGQYFLLDKGESKRVKSVIFQCPSKLGKGILIAPTAHGNIIVGPNAEDCGFDDLETTSQGLAFVKDMAKRSVPGLNFGENIRNFAGVRAISKKCDDFIIEPSEKNKKFINVAGIKSPGLSASCAIGKMVVNMLEDSGVKLNPASDFKLCPRPSKVSELPPDEINKKVAENPAYGKIVCRCESVTEGEIIDAVQSPSGARTIDAVKRRCTAGLGRCQGGFCSVRVHSIISKYAKIPFEKVYKEAEGSYIVCGKTRGGESNG